MANALFAVVDGLVALWMIYYLHQHRTGFKRYPFTHHTIEPIHDIQQNRWSDTMAHGLHCQHGGPDNVSFWGPFLKWKLDNYVLKACRLNWDSYGMLYRAS